MNSNLNKPLSLRAIVSELLSSYNRVHPERTSPIINSVSDNVFIYQRKNRVVHLLGDLYKLIAPLSKDETIHVAAKVVKGDIELYIVPKEKKKKGLLVKLFPILSPTEGIFPIHYYSGFIA